MKQPAVNPFALMGWMAKLILTPYRAGGSRVRSLVSLFVALVFVAYASGLLASAQPLPEVEFIGIAVGGYSSGGEWWWLVRVADLASGPSELRDAVVTVFMAPVNPEENPTDTSTRTSRKTTLWRFTAGMRVEAC